LNALRIDAAGYQIKIIEYCDEQGIDYAIRAKTRAAMRAQIEVAKVVKTGWQLFVKLKEKHRTLLEQVLLALKGFEPPPI